jgi:ATP-binding protein involved in chromosome partitioning
MSNITKELLFKALSNVIDPDLQKDIVSLGFIKDTKISDDEIYVEIQLTTPACPMKDFMKRESEKYIRDIGFTGNIKINLTSSVMSHIHENKEKNILPKVKNSIAIASGKGGVGKSTIAVNLAVALAMENVKVGLIDADIYGPSIPLMMKTENEMPNVVSIEGNNKLVPLERYGVKLMSIGFLVDPDQAVIWRGPMASSVLKQFMTDVIWEELDYLIFDLPPGTGDIQLTLVQTIPLTGAVIITTPQDISLADVKKGVSMFEKVEVPILGVIENMSYFLCKKCGQRENIFSNGGGEKISKELNVTFLGEIPITTGIRACGDLGDPIVHYDPTCEQSEQIRKIAKSLAAEISKINSKLNKSDLVQINLDNIKNTN